ncbi:glycoside hydrolase family 2 protein [Moritella marina]|uniref:glycoside hydrolase family 2 protein n=1 Tax=Moritella marina TaxID=90736 RepID=UPI003703F190
MSIKTVFILLSILLVTSCSTSKHSHGVKPHSQSLNGDWQFEIIPPTLIQLDNSQLDNSQLDNNQSVASGAVTAISVPNNWHNEGVDHAGKAIYHRQFTLPNVATSSSLTSSSMSLLAKRYWLDFTAVDYAAVVRLNNIDVGSHQGYFAPFSLDVSNAINGGDNQLEVLVDSPNEKLTQDWSLNKTLIKGVLNHHDTRPGGAWSDRGQERNSGGIWGDVALRTTGLVAIDNVKVKAEVLNVNLQKTAGQVAITLDSLYAGDVTLEFKLIRIQSNSSGDLALDDKKQVLESEIETYRLNTQVVTGKQVIHWQLPQVKRALWWPWDWGNPNLYQLSVQVSINGETSDVSKQNIGFRNVAFDEDEGVFYINDRAYFIRGTNYIASQWLGGVSEQDYADDIALMRQANINSIRVHAHVAGKAFYQQADKLGMIVWQDFPLQWGYSDSAEFRTEAVAQVKDMTDMLYNHASIAFWCGQNEPPWDATWMQYKYPSYTADKNLALTEAVYQQLLTVNDDRIVRKASYTAEHPWLGWYSGHYSDYSQKPKTAIVSEFGAQAMPSYSAVIDMLGEVPTWPLTNTVIKQLSYHNYQPRETLQIAKIDEGESLSQFVSNSQEYQRLITKSAIEQLRLNKGSGLAAIYQFMFNDSWNSITWSVLDVDRIAKPGFIAMQSAYQPLLAILERDRNNTNEPISITVINDSLLAYSDMKMLIKDNEDGDSWIMSGINIDANSSSIILNKQLLVGLPGAVTIILYDQQDNEVSRNDYLAQDR